MMLVDVVKKFSEMRRLKLIDYQAEIESKFHAVPRLFKKSRAEIFDGVAPLDILIMTNYAIDEREYTMGGVRRIYELLMGRRYMAMMRLVREAEQQFYLRCGRRKNPNGWKVRVNRFWLREVVQQYIQQPTVTAVFITLQFSLYQLPQRGPS